jgi:hypothetical protein
MKTYVSAILPKIQRFSKKLDNLTLLINQHWVVIDDFDKNKIVYIFRLNNELLISINGKVEKAKWEYLGQNSLLIDRKDESYLFKHGFFDENILALKIDSKDEYAFLINENTYDGELNSIERVNDFLNMKYNEPQIRQNIEDTTDIITKNPTKENRTKYVLMPYETDQGTLEIEQKQNSFPEIYEGRNAFINGLKAPDGKYKLGYRFYVYILDGQVSGESLF